MSESFWFMLVLWIVMLAFGLRYRKVWIISTVSSVLGLFFGSLLMSEEVIILNFAGFVVLLFNVYILSVTLLMEVR